MSTKMNKKDLGEWQERNCTDCPYSEPKTVGTGKPCCYDYTEVYGMNDKGECVQKHPLVKKEPSPPKWKIRR